MKKVSLRVMAAMTMGLAVVGCSHDSDSYMPSNEEQLANATEKLGVEVDPNQDWNMTSTAKASITVNGEYGETYIVKILANDPLVDGFSYVLAEGELANDETFTSEFEYASADKSLIVALTNHNGYTTYRSLPVVDGVMEATIGEAQAAGTRGALRSQTNPSVGHITIPDAAYVNKYLEGAKEPDENNTTDDHDDSTYAINYGEGGPNYIDWNDPEQYAEREKFFQLTWEEQIAYAKAHHPSWLTYTIDENYVLKFKITGTYDKGIKVLATEENPINNTKARSVYISGKWTVASPDDNSSEQRVGGGAVIIVDNGGELNIPAGINMTFVNEARLVVMPGGKITGEGKIEVTNGNADGTEGYNGGSIQIGTFNNNSGKFYNYGTFKADLLQGGAGLSNIYNHGLVHIGKTGNSTSSGGNYDTPNTRIYNACQWYCDNDMRAYVIENTQGSYFYVGGELMMSDGTDGEADKSYVALANGSLMRLGSLWNNNTTWVGPTSGYAVVETGGVSYLNWEPGTPIPANGGYMINNIAISVDDPTIGQGQGTDTYVALRDYILNGYGTTGDYFNPRGTTPAPQGNNGAVLIAKGGANVNIPGSDDFVAGEKGCTPGYNGVPSKTPAPRSAVWSYAFEDTPLGDYDMNDVVIKVSYAYDEDTKKVDNSHLNVTLCCTGATLKLKVYLNNTVLFGGEEVHEALGRTAPELVNTGAGPDTETYTVTINTPENFEFGTADFWIDSPLVPGGVHIAKAGQDPHGIVIPADWAWPTEYTCIKDAYPNFIEFAKDASTTDEAILNWYKQTPVAGKTYKQ